MKDSFQTTAIKRNKLSAPTQILVSKNYLYQSDAILDYGCGHGSDVELLRDQGFDAVGYDRFNPKFGYSHGHEVFLSKMIEDKFGCNIVICNYVFNVIANPQERQHLIDTLRKVPAKTFVAVRSDQNSIKHTWKYDQIAGGYYTKRSFQRIYTERDVFEEFGPEIEIIKSNKSLILFVL